MRLTILVLIYFDSVTIMMQSDTGETGANGK